MRNLLALLLFVFVLGGLGLWWVAGSGDAVAPLDVEAADSNEETPRSPADLIRPEPDPVEPEVETSEPELVPMIDATAVAEKREAVKSHHPIEVRGRVVDIVTGDGVSACWVSLVCGQRREVWVSPLPFAELDETREPGALMQVQTDPNGEFAFEVPEKELDSLCSVFASGSVGWHVLNAQQELALDTLLNGAEILFEAKQWPPPVAGDIRGSLRSESGSFSDDALPRTDHLLLDLVSTALPAIERRAEIERVEDEEGGLQLQFVFKDVPEGEYNLTLSSLGHYRWTPHSMLVVPPMEGIEFLRFDLDETLPLEFKVVDARTQEAIEDFEARHIKQTNSEEHGVLLHTGPLEGEQFPLDQAFTWSLEADGYGVAYGNESAFRIEDGRRVALVELQPGWSTRFLIMGGAKGGRPRPLAGADIYIDEEFQGRSGPNGGLVVRLPEQPSRVEVRYLDWAPMNPITLVKRRSNVIPVVMAEPERD